MNCGNDLRWKFPSGRDSSPAIIMPGFRDVHGDLGRRAAFRVRPEVQIRVGQVFDFGDDAVARVAPGFEGFFEQSSERHDGKITTSPDVRLTASVTLPR